MDTNQIKKMSPNPNEEEKSSKFTQYCNICRCEFDVIEFKNHCICEECVEYIKVNF